MHDAVITHSLSNGSSQININSAGGSPDTPRSFTHLVLWVSHVHIISQAAESGSHEQQAFQVGMHPGPTLKDRIRSNPPCDKWQMFNPAAFWILEVALGIVKVRREVICQEIYI